MLPVPAQFYHALHQSEHSPAATESYKVELLDPVADLIYANEQTELFNQLATSCFTASHFPTSWLGYEN